MGNLGAQTHAADHLACIERKHGGHRVHYKLGAFAVREHALAAGCVAASDVATPCARRARAVLRVLFDDVGLERDPVAQRVAILSEEDYSSSQSDGW